jgi:hypothetical protein
MSDKETERAPSKKCPQDGFVSAHSNRRHKRSIRAAQGVRGQRCYRVAVSVCVCVCVVVWGWYVHIGHAKFRTHMLLCCAALGGNHSAGELVVQSNIMALDQRAGRTRHKPGITSPHSHTRHRRNRALRCPSLAGTKFALKPSQVKSLIVCAGIGGSHRIE